MELISELIKTGLGYILKGAAQSKAIGTASEELLQATWNWIKPLLIKDVPELDTNPESPETEEKTCKKLLELVKDENFFKELVNRIDTLRKAGIKEKNVVNGNLMDIDEIHIGDRIYNPNEPYDIKNKITGDVKNAKTFRLGDG